jgi:hypothetical protein
LQRSKPTPDDIAIGLFRTLGTAEDVRARLLHEGLPEDLIELRRLAKDATIPPQLTPQTMISFLDWIFGNDLPERYGVHVTNGETAVGVHCRNEEDLSLALAVMRLFAPLLVERVRPTAPA